MSGEVYAQAFIVSGPPTPYTRMTRNQVRSRNLTRQQANYLAYKERVGWDWMEAYGGTEPFSGIVTISVDVFLRDPDSRKWDCSNVLKAVEDALNGVAYVDDKQIIRAEVAVWQEPVDDDHILVSLKGKYTT